MVAGFGPLSEDNRINITMEWVAEGLALAFVGALVALVTSVGGADDPVRRVVVWAIAAFCVLMGAWTFIVGRPAPSCRSGCVHGVSRGRCAVAVGEPAVSRRYPVPRLQLLNCFWLLLPIFLWNAVFAARLPQQGFKSDAGVPQVVLVAETVLRIAVFVLAALTAAGLAGSEEPGRAGAVWPGPARLLRIVAAADLSSAGAWSTSAAGLLAPAYTPLIWLAGIAVIGGSWPYALLSWLFVGTHIYHNILAHHLLSGQ